MKRGAQLHGPGPSVKMYVVERPYQSAAGRTHNRVSIQAARSIVTNLNVLSLTRSNWRRHRNYPDGTPGSIDGSCRGLSAADEAQ